jgi:hypothetical protein
MAEILEINHFMELKDLNMVKYLDNMFHNMIHQLKSDHHQINTLI